MTSPVRADGISAGPLRAALPPTLTSAPHLSAGNWLRFRVLPPYARPNRHAFLIFPFSSTGSYFATSKVAESAWDKATKSNARATPKLFEGLSGEMPLSAVNRAIVADFRSALFRLPRYYDKSFQAFTLKDAIVEADKLDKQRPDGKEPVARLKLPTVDKHFGNLIEYWRWMGKTGKIPTPLECPFTGYIQPKEQGRAARDLRDQWPLDMQTVLFTSPVWTGCKSIHRRGQAGEEIHRDALFWAPILGRLWGAREDEICGALVEDIRCESGIEYPPGETGRDLIRYLRIIDSKTAGSTRNLPLPDSVLMLGFLEHRIYGRDPKEPLFPELIPQGPANARSAAFTGRFTEYRRKVGAYRPLVDFHSFRANLSTDLQNMPGLNPAWGDEITGHIAKVRESVRSLYSKGVLLNHLLNTLN